MNNEENNNSNINTISPQTQKELEQNARIEERKAAVNQRAEEQRMAKVQEQNDRQEASNKAAKVGLKAAGNYLAPGVGGQIVDAASNTKLGQDIINKSGEAINRIPGMGKKLDKLNKSGLLDAADSATDMMGGGKGSPSPKQANRSNPGNNLQGVVKPKEIDLPKPEENKETTSNEILNPATESNDSKGTIEGNKNTFLKFITKHPQIALAIAGSIFFVLFIIFVIILGSTTSYYLFGDNSSSSNGSLTVQGNAAKTPTNKDTELHDSLESFLQSKGTNIEEYNNFIFSSVNKAGVGTREGVVTAALAITSTLYENYKVRLPYEWGGGHGSMYYGASGKWGSKLAKPIAANSRFYLYSGLDCSGFISWALYNGGYNVTPLTSEGFLQYGPAHKMSEGNFIGKPGDLIHHYGHIMMIVDTDESSKTYLVAEAAGGDEGMRVISLPFNGGNSSKQNSIIDMDSFYADTSRKSNNYPQVTNSNLTNDNNSINNIDDDKENNLSEITE